MTDLTTALSRARLLEKIAEAAQAFADEYHIILGGLSQGNAAGALARLPDATAAFNVLTAALARRESMPPQMSLDILREKIVEWGDATFRDSTEATVLAHLKHEVETELHTSCDGEEIADVVMLAMQLAHKRHLDLASLLHAKLAKNMARKWRFDPALGFSVHVKEPQCKVCGDSGTESVLAADQPEDGVAIEYMGPCRACKEPQ
jgi:hypothetical protein